ncbi:MAG: hypothetical protein EU548_03955 [Promethearchaeota archaeon]|nr:MAG: hypothetical protein EU548_03955 [Candidatus Lokiarchaeota archaeon]
MDTGSDFIQPEFLNILFFEQKNLVIFPYVDLKHLHALECFTVGYNAIDLETTALNNIREIIEFEAFNSYSQNKTMFFIYNLDCKKVKEVMQLSDIHCILNINEDVNSLANSDSFVFYNKKTKKFINYNPRYTDLSFEEHLIADSKNVVEVLQDKIQKIKSTATRLFSEVNKDPEMRSLPMILEDYDPMFWPKIIKFTGLYFKVDFPEFDYRFYQSKKDLKELNKNKKQLKDYSDEFRFIVGQNDDVGREFVQLLYQYRSLNVNPSNLELEQLHTPLKLYNYLRNHHWSLNIPEEFLIDWVHMKSTGHKLNDIDVSDFKRIFNKLNIPNDLLGGIKCKIKNHDSLLEIEKKIEEEKAANYISPITDFSKFKRRLLKRVKEIVSLIDKKGEV